MTEAIINIVIGLALFITINAFRQKKLAGLGDGLYWGTFLTLGLAIQTASIPLVYFLIIIPALLRVQLLQYTGSKGFLNPLVSVLLSLIVAYLLLTFTTFGNIAIGILCFFEVASLINTVRKVFRSKGISWSRNTGSKVNWLRGFIALNLILLLSLYVDHIQPGSNSTIFLTASYLLIGFLGIIRYTVQKESFQPLTPSEKYAKSSLDHQEKYRILKAINHEMEVNRFYLNPEASLKTLADSVKASPHAVSQVINEEKGGSFFEMLAVYRVGEARRLLKKPKYQQYKIEQIAEEVGYLSKSAFNTSFKKITTLTPSEFRERHVREHKVERSNHKEITTNIISTGTFGYLKISMIMFSSFFKLYIRNLGKNRVFTFLNLSGLIVGFTSCVLILLYVNGELSYDKFHRGSENIYRIYLNATNPQTRTPHPMAQALVSDFPEVESAVSLTPLYGPGLTLQSIHLRNPEDNTMHSEPDGYAADSTFFDVFDFELIAGNKETALKDVGGMLITESMARKFFGNEDPMGKELEFVAFGGRNVINGILKDPPKESHFHPRFIISYTTMKSGNGDDPWFKWNDPGHFNYVRLSPGADPEVLENAIPNWIVNVSSGVDQEMIDALLAGSVSYRLQPMESIHLDSHLRWELEANSSSIYIYILLGAVLFITIILSINYINLSTARILERNREVGIRRILGASRIGLSAQFIMESLFTCLLAMVTAFVAAVLLLDQFNILTDKQFVFHELLDFQLILYGILLITAIGLISGLVPSVSFSKVKPSEALKGKMLTKANKGWRQYTLVGIQFSISAIMIFASIMVLKQVKFLENKSMGFDSEALMVLKLPTQDLTNSANTIKSELLTDPSILQVGGLTNLPGEQFNQNDIYLESDPASRVPASELWVDFDGLQTLGLTLKEGRFFNSSFQQDSSGINYILNQVAVEALNLENPVDSKVIWNSNIRPVEGTVVGVVENFNYKSLHEPIRPLLIMVGLSSVHNLLMRVNTEDIDKTVAHIEQVYQQFDTTFEPDVTFLDNSLNQLYLAERNSFRIFNLFTSIALILAALGLLGLAYLIVTQRTKEIGIRKVLGARITDILWLENSTFLKVTLLALMVSLSASPFVVTRWLEEFAYQTTFGVSPYLVTGSILLIVTMGSVTLAVLRTVLRNPSEALRYE